MNVPQDPHFPRTPHFSPFAPPQSRKHPFVSGKIIHKLLSSGLKRRESLIRWSHGLPTGHASRHGRFRAFLPPAQLSHEDVIVVGRDRWTRRDVATRPCVPP